jgi:hypothetical protein
MNERQPPPEFGNWGPPRQFDDFSVMPPQYGQSLPHNSFDGPHNRPNPTFGREPPRFFGGGPDDSQDKSAPFGPEIEKILQTFRGDEPRQNIVGPGFAPQDNFSGPPPLVPLFPAPLMKNQHGKCY